MKLDESPPPDQPTLTTPLPLPPTPPPRHRASTPESPTPQRGLTLAPSPPPLVHSPRPSSPTPAPHHSMPDAMPPTDLARQIATVTEDLAGLRAEEQRLSQVQHDNVRLSTHSADIFFSPWAQPQQQQDALPRASTPPRLTFRRILLVEEECIRYALHSPFWHLLTNRRRIVVDCAQSSLRLPRVRRRYASCSYLHLYPRQGRGQRTCWTTMATRKARKWISQRHCSPRYCSIPKMYGQDRCLGFSYLSYDLIPYLSHHLPFSIPLCS